MAYRQFDTTTWSDPWFKRLSPPAKLLFIYLWTNDRCNAAGMYRLDKKIMVIESGLNGHDPHALLDELSPKIEYCHQEEVIWIKNFFKWQCENPSFCVSAIKAAEKMPLRYYVNFLTYNTKRIQHRLGDSKYQNLLNKITRCQQSADTFLTEQNRTEQKQNSITFSKEKEAKPAINEEIEKLAEQMKPAWDKVFAFVNAMRKKSKHPGSILLALTQVAMHEPKDPWPYAKQIVEVESQNFYEQESIAESEKHKGKK